jgi:hypothetical protein
MRNRLLLALGLALTVGSLARAATPLTPTFVGEVDGIISSCISVDPRDEDKYAKLRLAMVPHPGPHLRAHHVAQGRDDDEDRTQLQKDPGYKSSFTLMQSIFTGMPADEAVKLCKAAI